MIIPLLLCGAARGDERNVGGEDFVLSDTSDVLAVKEAGGDMLAVDDSVARRLEGDMLAVVDVARRQEGDMLAVVDVARRREDPVCGCENGEVQEHAHGNWCWLQETPCTMLTGELTDENWRWISCEYRGEQQVDCKITCECNGKVQENAEHGDWCWLKQTPCELLDGDWADGSWEWARCEWEGEPAVDCSSGTNDWIFADDFNGAQGWYFDYKGDMWYQDADGNDKKNPGWYNSEDNFWNVYNNGEGEAMSKRGDTIGWFFDANGRDFYYPWGYDFDGWEDYKWKLPGWYADGDGQVPWYVYYNNYASYYAPYYWYYNWYYFNQNGPDDYNYYNDYYNYYGYYYNYYPYWWYYYYGYYPYYYYGYYPYYYYGYYPYYYYYYYGDDYYNYYGDGCWWRRLEDGEWRRREECEYDDYGEYDYNGYHGAYDNGAYYHDDYEDCRRRGEDGEGCEYNYHDYDEDCRRRGEDGEGCGGKQQPAGFDAYEPASDFEKFDNTVYNRDFRDFRQHQFRLNHDNHVIDDFKLLLEQDDWRRRVEDPGVALPYGFNEGYNHGVDDAAEQGHWMVDWKPRRREGTTDGTQAGVVAVDNNGAIKEFRPDPRFVDASMADPGLLSNLTNDWYPDIGGSDKLQTACTGFMDKSGTVTLDSSDKSTESALCESAMQFAGCDETGQNCDPNVDVQKLLVYLYNMWTGQQGMDDATMTEDQKNAVEKLVGLPMNNIDSYTKEQLANEDPVASTDDKATSTRTRTQLQINGKSVLSPQQAQDLQDFLTTEWNSLTSKDFDGNRKLSISELNAYLADSATAAHSMTKTNIPRRIVLNTQPSGLLVSGDEGILMLILGIYVLVLSFFVFYMFWMYYIQLMPYNPKNPNKQLSKEVSVTVQMGQQKYSTIDN